MRLELPRGHQLFDARAGRGLGGRALPALAALVVAAPVQRQAPGDPDQPGPEPSAVLQPRKVPIRLGHRFLRDVLGVLAMAQDAAGDGRPRPAAPAGRSPPPRAPPTPEGARCRGRARPSASRSTCRWTRGPARAAPRPGGRTRRWPGGWTSRARTGPGARRPGRAP